MILGARIERLRDDDGPHNDPENGPADERGSSSRPVQPLGKTAGVKFLGSDAFGVVEIAVEIGANGADIGAG